LKFSNISVGKWHLGHYCPQCLPRNRGFDSFYGYLTGAEDYYKKTFCIPLVPNQRPPACGYDFYKNETGDPSANGTYSTFLYRDQVNALIDDHDKNAPFFLYLPFQSVHYPVMVPKNYSDLYPNVKDHRRRTYMGMVTAMDEAIGGIVKKLGDSGMLENTVFFYATDNGGLIGAGGSNLPFRGQKATLWEGGLRVPAFMSGPGVPRGKTYSNMMHIVDVQMTLLDLIGQKHSGEKPLDGVSHWAHIKAGVNKSGKIKFGAKSKSRTFRAIRSRTQRGKNFSLRSEWPKEAPRKEILLNIDRFFLRENNGEGPDPINFTEYPNPFFPNTSIHAAIVAEVDGITWKLLTGDPGCSLFNAPCNKTVPIPDPFPSVHLYNLDLDPYERENIFEQFPGMVMHLLERLSIYDENSYPTYYPPRDPAADPKLHGGYWGPWKEHPEHWPRSETLRQSENDVFA